jgi:hypothetical protein
MDEYRVTWLEQRIGILEGREQDLLKRIVNLEQQVANQAVHGQKVDTLFEGRLNTLADRVGGLEHHLNVQPFIKEMTLKSQAAATQATEHLYAPLRSDTKPLLEMAAFVRKIADYGSFPFSVNQLGADIVTEAREILKRST